MSRRTIRRERTLSVQPADPAAVPTAANSTTVIDLPVLNLREGPGRSAAVSKPPEPAVEELKKNDSSENDVRPSPEFAADGRTGSLKTTLKAALWIALLPFLGILPFVVVLRFAVVAYRADTLAGWESLGIGMLAAVLLVCAGIAAFIWTFNVRRSFFMPLLNVCLTAMLCYSGFALFHLATSNAKTEQVRTYYTSLHPFLRVAVKNLTLVDEDLVITDTQRTRQDYRDMGLRTRDQSLHFRQPTGFVHAVDIRTKGRSKLSNLLIESYFVLMGFETLRHTGTADHLHVSLPFAHMDV